jgi:hypothetical protein
LDLEVRVEDADSDAAVALAPAKVPQVKARPSRSPEKR